MSNPILGWIPVTDQFGTKVADMRLYVNYSITNWYNGAWGQFTEVFTQVVVMPLATVAMWLMSLAQDQGLWVEVLGSVYQTVIDKVYQVVNPFWIVGLAVPILFFRIFVGEPQRETVKSKGGGPTKGADKTRLTFKFNQSTLADDEKFRKQVVTQLFQIAAVIGTISALILNPFALISWLFNILVGLANSFTATLAGRSGSDPTGITSTVVDGMLVPALQIINFGTVLDPDCSAQWSAALRAGAETNTLDCIPGGKAASDASLVQLFSAFFLGVAILCLAAFVIVCVYRLTFFEAKMIWHVFVLPWKLALMLFSPGRDRERLDEGIRAGSQAAINLGWALGLVLILNLVPGLGMAVANQIVTRIGGGGWMALVFIILGAFYAAVAYAVWKLYGRSVKWDSEKKRLRFVESDTAMSWHGVIHNLREAGKEEKKDPKEADKTEDEKAEEAAKKESAEAAAAGGEGAEEAIVDEASGGLDETPDYTPKIPVLIRPNTRGALLPPGTSTGTGSPPSPVGQRPGVPPSLPGSGGAAAALTSGAPTDDDPPMAPSPATPSVVLFSTADQRQAFLNQNNHTTINNLPGAAAAGAAGAVAGVAGAAAAGAGAAHLAADRRGVGRDLPVIEGEVVPDHLGAPAGTPALGAASAASTTAEAGQAPVYEGVAQPLDPAMAYRQQIADLQAQTHYAEDLGSGYGAGDDYSEAAFDGRGAAPAASVAAAMSGGGIDEVASAALSRIQNEFTEAESAAVPVVGHTVDGHPIVAAPSSSEAFFGRESIHGRYRTLKRLADTLGYAIDAQVVDTASTEALSVETGLDGRPHIRFGNPYGFGDDI